MSLSVVTPTHHSPHPYLTEGQFLNNPKKQRKKPLPSSSPLQESLLWGVFSGVSRESLQEMAFQGGVERSVSRVEPRPAESLVSESFFSISLLLDYGFTPDELRSSAPLQPSTHLGSACLPGGGSFHRFGDQERLSDTLQHTQSTFYSRSGALQQTVTQRFSFRGAPYVLGDTWITTVLLPGRTSC